MILSSMTGMAALPLTGASQVVITDAVQVVDDGANSQQSAVVSDSDGNVHMVWTKNNQQLIYSMMDPRGFTLIAPTQLNDNGGARTWHPDVAIDSMDRIHITWTDKSGNHAIMYTCINPFLDDLDGSMASDGAITVITDTIVEKRTNNRDWPAIALDSKNAVHITWEDNYDSLDKFFAQPQIYYAMLEPNYPATQADVIFDSTLLTPIIGHKGHPDIAIDGDDFVQVVWDDTRGGKVELVFVIDTSGSMYSEWADVCTVVYGGNFAGGSYFQGIKPMLKDANMTVYETIYGLGSYMPGAASSGDCSNVNPNGADGQGPRNTPLGLVVGDDSGGIRKLPGTIYNGATYSGYSGEDWGPGSNWACLSWQDAQGNIPGNPPTSDDHKWNPNATKIVIPVSDEGPKDGDPSGQSDDHQSIQEAHDSCVRAGVIPTGLYGQSYGGATTVQSHFKDLAQCSDGQQGTHTRNCPGTTIANSDAGGQTFEFPSSSGTSQMALLVEAMVYISTNNSREIYTTVLDPYSKIANTPGFQPGLPGHLVTGNSYVEDIGKGSEGHLVVVNDTRVTIDDAYSFHPSLSIDQAGNSHIAWMDGRDYGFAKDVNYEIYYTKLRLKGAGDWDGVPGGLSTYAIKKIDDTAISNVETPSGIQQNRPFGGMSAYPSLLTDYQNNVHIAWHDFGNATAGEEIVYVRLNETSLTGPGLDALDPWDIVVVTHWESFKLGPNSFNSPEIGMPPAFSNDLGSGAHMAWSDTNKCNEETNNFQWTMCYTHILTGQVDIEFGPAETYYHVIEPGEQTAFNLTLNNSTPGPTDLVADTYSLNLSGVPANWTATLYFTSNDTAIFPETPIFLSGGELIPFYLRVRAPSIYQALADERAPITVSAVSFKDPAIRSDMITITDMDVVHGINLDTSHSMADVEQGQTAIFSITITNTGNVYDTFAFHDPNTLNGQAEWFLPFGWQVNFPLSVSLDPGQSVTKNLEVSIPISEDPGTFVIYLKGWSVGEPVLDMNAGTYDILSLWINVSIRSTGNIVFEIFDTSEYVLPGDCASYDIDVIKNFAPGFLMFTTPGAPEAKPDEVSLNDWREEHWTVELDFSNAPPDPDGDGKRRWDVGVAYTVTAIVCAPFNAGSGLGPAVSVKANLDGHSRVSDSVILSTNVIHVYDLDMSSEGSDSVLITANPGEEWTVPVTTANFGNGADRYDMRLSSITDSEGIEVLWDVDVPRNFLIELQRDEGQEVNVVIDVPLQVSAGTYFIFLECFSEEAYPQTGPTSTRLRDQLIVTVEVREFHDMRIDLDPTVENSVKTTAPGRTVRYTVNITNNGNVPDTPSLHNHTASRSGDEWIWNEVPGMGTLSEWSVSWAIVYNFDNSQPETEEECLQMVSGEALPTDRCVFLTDIQEHMLPEMQPYSTITMRAIITIGANAMLETRPLGLKVTSMYGDMTEDGDYDSTPSWAGSMLDSNELIITLRLRAPNLEIVEASVSDAESSAEIGAAIPIRVIVQNTGNVHASDVEIILCQDQDAADVRENGCDDENIVYRQTIGALTPPDDTGKAKQVEAYLLYPVVAGSHVVTVVIDPMDTIVEQKENDNFLTVNDGDKLSSSNPILDVAGEFVGEWALPFGVLLLTLSLLSVAFLVGRGRTREANQRLAEQSSLMNVIGEDQD
jgi:uncharacterized membrane protein